MPLSSDDCCVGCISRNQNASHGRSSPVPRGLDLPGFFRDPPFHATAARVWSPRCLTTSRDSLLNCQQPCRCVRLLHVALVYSLEPSFSRILHVCPSRILNLPRQPDLPSHRLDTHIPAEGLSTASIFPYRRKALPGVDTRHMYKLS